jgi:hypothetical protein
MEAGAVATTLGMSHDGNTEARRRHKGRNISRVAVSSPFFNFNVAT